MAATVTADLMVKRGSGVECPAREGRKGERERGAEEDGVGRACRDGVGGWKGCMGG